MAALAPTRRPISSYRLQLGPSFGFRDAARLLPYLVRLGVSECYLSPILRARPGSQHQYDVCDHGRLSDELGGASGFAELAQAARAHDVGLLVDFVPNHVAADSSANNWWRSVLENGPSSPFAPYFDIDWDPVKPELKGRVLLPILGEQYGITLEAGNLQLQLEDERLTLRYFDQVLPLNPRQLRLIYGHNLNRLEEQLSSGAPELTEYRSILFHLEHLPIYTSTDRASIDARRREADVALGRLRTLIAHSPVVRSHLAELVKLYNGTPGEPASFDLLHQLLEAQAYRLASWRTAMHEINYRRFFDVNELAGIRQEEPAVFDATHHLLAQHVAEGSITGVRLDHVDGLFEPSEYLTRLASRLGVHGPVWTLVEKILSPGEQLNPAWPVHGTSGYEFLNQVNAVFVDPNGVRELERIFGRFTNNEKSFADVVYFGKKAIIATSMAAELNVLAAALNRISESDRRFRDFTLDSLQEALEEVVACFPVYRSYVRPDGWVAADEAVADHAIAEALRRNPALEPTIFAFIRAMLLPERAAAPDLEEWDRRLRFAMKFQQYTAPVQAKGIEDTAFYRSAPVAALNEVGGGRDVPENPVRAFHQANAERLRHWPLSMIATATHDTKWGEDARARLTVLSEIPQAWNALTSRWRDITRDAHSRLPGGVAPDPADEYLFYQALLAVWPNAAIGPPNVELIDRMHGYMQKAMREAKVHTSWVNPVATYEAAVHDFVSDVLSGACSTAFLDSFAPIARRVAWLGMLNSVSQLLLKLVSPGVPDMYQGTELWDLSMVDPDNRRAVDHARREQMLDQLMPLLTDSLSPTSGASLRSQLLEGWSDGRVKMLAAAAALRCRRQNPSLFVDGEYHALATAGRCAVHLVALARVKGADAAIAVVPRLPATLVGWDNPERVPVGSATWGDSVVNLPPGLAGRSWYNVLTARTLRVEGPTLVASDALAELPWGLFVSTNSAPKHSSTILQDET